MTVPLNVIAKYIAIRKSSEIITPDRAFALCYFVRGCSIVLYRTMQSGFQNIWLFIGLSLLHGVSNVLSKATLNLRIKIWKSFIKFYNRSCCGPRLSMQPLNSPTIHRFNADLEIQYILFEYTTVILSQAYLACNELRYPTLFWYPTLFSISYFDILPYISISYPIFDILFCQVMSFDILPWQVMKRSLIKIAISLAIDFVFNTISVFIQIHNYDIPMRKVWLKYWRRHVTINAFMLIITVSYFGTPLVSVFAGQTYMSKDYELRNCTSLF
jgi:hypothetical protein